MEEYVSQDEHLRLVGEHQRLANEVAAANGDVAGAFLKYQQQRYLRTGRVQLTARFFGEIYHAGGATADVRNEIFFKAPPTATPGESMAWLYDGIAP